MRIVKLFFSLVLNQKILDKSNVLDKSGVLDKKLGKKSYNKPNLDPKVYEAGHYYTYYGFYMGNSAKNATTVFVEDKIADRQFHKLNISNDDLLRMAGLAYGETAFNTDAIKGLPKAILNRHRQLLNSGLEKYKSKKWAIHESILHSRAQSDVVYARNPVFAEFINYKAGESVIFTKNAHQRNDNQKMMDAISAVFRAFQGEFDYSYGAIGWHGTDILDNNWANQFRLKIHEEHAKYGFDGYLGWQEDNAYFESTAVYQANQYLSQYKNATTLFYKSTDYAFSLSRTGLIAEA